MKELNRFRKFLAEGVEEKKVNENKLPKGDPAMEKNEIQDFLSRQFPDEWPGSWTGDLTTGTFKAPYEHIMLATNQEDVEDYFSGKEEMINQLPTEWVKVEEFTTKGQGGENFQVMNFAKYVPGKGIYAAATTDKKLAEGVEKKKVNEIANKTNYIEKELEDGVTLIVSFEIEGLEEELELDYGTLEEITEVVMVKGVKLYFIYI